MFGRFQVVVEMRRFYPVDTVEYLIHLKWRRKSKQRVMVFDNNCIFRRRISQNKLCFLCYLANCGVMYNTEIKWKLFMGLKAIERLECMSVCTKVESQLSGNLHLLCTQLCTVFR